MARACKLSGKGPLFGHRVSHSNIKTKHKFLPNLHKKKFWSEKRKCFVKIRVSASTIRDIDKMGFDTLLNKIK